MERVLEKAAAGVVLLTGLSLAAGTAGAQEVPRNGYVSDVRLIITGDVPRTGAAAAAYQKLLDQKAYHGAFAVGPDGAYGWADNYPRQADADTAALGWCAVQGCRVVAQIAPQDVIEIDGQPLSRTAALGAEDYLGKPSPKALALSNMGHWGMVWGEANKATAAKNALAECDAYLTSESAGSLNGGICRVVWVD